MALVDLKTDLKNLKYSEFSPEVRGPYVTKDINNQQAFDPSINQIQARTDDLKRVSNVLKDSPNFIINQTALRFTSNTSKLLAADSNEEKREALKKVALSPVNAARAIGSLLAQVPVSGTGLHLVYELRDGGGGTYLGKIASSTTLYGKTVNDKPLRETSPIKERIERQINLGEIERPSKYPITETNSTSYLGDTEPATKEVKENRNVVPVTKNGFNLKVVKRTDEELGTRYDPDPISILDIQTEPLGNQESDIIPFEIGIVTPDRIGGADVDFFTNEYIYFRAYLESLSDDFNGNWSSVEYIGRAEPLFTYTGFNRGIRFGFKIAAESENELKPLYKKLNKLVGTLSPSYSPNNIFMRGIFTRLTIGDYLYKLPGFFSNITLNWDKSYPWEIGVDQVARPVRERTELIKVPHILDVECSFTPIHSFNPQYGKTYFGNETKLNTSN